MADNGTRVTRRKLSDYTLDPRNANRGTERGIYMLDRSIEEVGLARSIVAAADGTIPAGNKTLQAAADAGIEDVIEVETDGRALVVVKRTDWETVDVEQARKYAYYDNRASEVGLEWDAEQVLADVGAGVDVSKVFSERELEILLYELNHDVLGGVVTEGVRDSQWNMINDRKENRREFIYFEWGDISILMPTALHDRVNAHISSGTYESRQAGLMALMEAGLLGCSE